MEESALKPVIVGRIVLDAQSCAVTDKAKAGRDHEEIRRRKQFEAHSAQRRKTSRPELEEGEIKEERADNTANPSSPTIPRIFTPVQRFPNPVNPIGELCPIFCTTGTCTAICPWIHDPKKISICPSVLRGQQCARWTTRDCRLNHAWSFHVAPTCANHLMGCCYATPCPYAHHDFVSTFSPMCEQFSKLGHCDGGHECHKIHWRGPIPEAAEAVKQIAKEDSIEREPEVAKAKVKECMRPRLLEGNAEADKKVGLKLFGSCQWKQKPEELVRGETTGELALQEDFVPF